VAATPPPISAGAAPAGPACFSLSASVETEGGPVLLRDLRVGQSVLAVRAADGARVWSPVYTNTHFSLSERTAFLYIGVNATGGGAGAGEAGSGAGSGAVTGAGALGGPRPPPLRELPISADHFLFVARGGCGAGGGASLASAELLRAREVRVGDGVFAAAGGGRWSAAAACAEVARVAPAAEEAGLSSPHTLEGSIVVNGIAASVYSDAEMGAAENHRATAPARRLWRLAQAALLRDAGTGTGTGLGAATDAAILQVALAARTVRMLQGPGGAACAAAAVAAAIALAGARAARRRRGRGGEAGCGRAASRVKPE